MSSALRSPRECLSPGFLASVSGKPRSTQCGPARPTTDFCKRSVPVASSCVELSSVAFRKVAYQYAYQTTPRSLLSGSFEKTRRAARTGKFASMAGRLAHTLSRPEFRKPNFGKPVFGKSVFGKSVVMSHVSSTSAAPPAKSPAAAQDWRPLRSVVAVVLSKAQNMPTSPTPKTGGQ